MMLSTWVVMACKGPTDDVCKVHLLCYVLLIHAGNPVGGDTLLLKLQQHKLHV